MNEISLREMTESDCREVSVLLDELGLPAGEDEVLRRFKSLKKRASGGQIVTALSGGKVIGLCAVDFTSVIHRSSEVGRIITLVVLRDYRKLGVGQRLVAHIEKIIASKGANRIEVTSAEERRQAHNFYESLGYLKEGFRFAKYL